MKTIGLIGGMSWESTVEYYRLINETVKARLGGLHSAQCVLYSVDFAAVAALQRQGQWAEAARLLVDAAQKVERAGADLVLVCTNTMHKLADAIQAGIGIPLLHIADATADSVNRAGLRRVGLLGTRFTMEEEFYRGRLVSKHGLEVVIPDDADRGLVHRVIYEELCVGIIRPESKVELAGVMNRLVERGAGGIILGCTELGLLIEAEDSRVPLFDTTREHALAAVDQALQSNAAGKESDATNAGCTTGHYSICALVKLPFERALRETHAALKAEELVVITEMDLQAQLATRLNQPIRPYTILGVWVPAWEYQALSQEPDIGLLMPSHVCLWDNGDGTCTLATADLKHLCDRGENSRLAEAARAVNAGLRAVVASVQFSGTLNKPETACP